MAKTILLYCIALVCALTEVMLAWLNLISTCWTQFQLQPPGGATRMTARLIPFVFHYLVPLRPSPSNRLSEYERILAVGSLDISFVPVARRQALLCVVVLRVYPNVQHLGVSARLSESLEKNTQTEMCVRHMSQNTQMSRNNT